MSQRQLQEERRQLPVYEFKRRFLEAVKQNHVLICVGETGSGKTTQLPQYLLESGFAETGSIVVTQPRRVAAISVSHRVAQEHGCKLGGTVGYRIRFEDCTSSRTKLVYMTDGTLVRECLSDSLLSCYSVVILDEAHERSINTDVLFGLLKEATKRRSDLRLIVTSATLPTEKFSRYLDGAPVLEIPGRMFPVDIYNTRENLCSDRMSQTLGVIVKTVFEIHEREDSGDILVFLPGKDGIDRAVAALAERDTNELYILPLYGALPTEKQTRVFRAAPPGRRKVVIATNIAETSLTVPGIRFVVDPGYCKQRWYDHVKGVDVLQVIPISRVSAVQRAGRAGRTAPGKCFRLYTKGWLEDQPKETVPEIQRCNLSNVVLQLKALGVSDVLAFDFIDPPARQSLISSLKLLFALGALSATGDLTGTGKMMAQLPVGPCLGRLLVESRSLGCVKAAAIVAAMLSVEGVFMSPRTFRNGGDAPSPDALRDIRKGFSDPAGDHLMYLKMYRAWRRQSHQREWCKDKCLHSRAFTMAHNIRKQTEASLEKLEKLFPRGLAPALRAESAEEGVAVRRAIAAGFFTNTAQLCAGDTFRILIDETKLVHVHPTSCLLDSPAIPWCVFHEVLHTSKPFMRHVVAVNVEWIRPGIRRWETVDLLSLCGPSVSEADLPEKQEPATAEPSAKRSQAPAKRPAKEALEAARERFLERKRRRIEKSAP